MHHVAICLSDPSGGYYKHALVTAASVFANTGGAVRLHVVHDDTLSAEAKKRFHALADSDGKEVRLYNAGNIPPEIEARVPENLGRGALFRLMLPDILAEDLVLYLDCDIVCECDVAGVFAHDVSRVLLGAVRFGPERVPYFVKRMHLDSSRYFNTGVLLMNLKKLRAEAPDLIPALFALIAAHTGKCTDQEALNIYCNKRSDSLVFLPDDYNFRIWQKDHSALALDGYAGKILHFAGRKPWEQFSHAAMHYWKYYCALFPDENVFERIIRMPAYEYSELCAFMLRTRLARRLVRRMYEMREKGLFKALFDRLTQGSGEERPGALRR